MDDQQEHHDTMIEDRADRQVAETPGIRPIDLARLQWTRR